MFSFKFCIYFSMLNPKQITLIVVFIAVSRNNAIEFYTNKNKIRFALKRKTNEKKNNAHTFYCDQSGFREFDIDTYECLFLVTNIFVHIIFRLLLIVSFFFFSFCTDVAVVVGVFYLFCPLKDNKNVRSAFSFLSIFLLSLSIPAKANGQTKVFLCIKSTHRFNFMRLNVWTDSINETNGQTHEFFTFL